MLSDESNLTDECIQGEGLVQIKVEVSNGKINIVDVLKPEEDLVPELDPNSRSITQSDNESPPKPSKIKREKSAISSKAQSQDKQTESVTRWVVSSSFRKEQERLNFPTDPLTWDRLHVAHWLHWAIDEFPDSQVRKGDWDIDGRELCALSHDDFKKKVFEDPNDTLWTHLELLRKCKFVAVIQRTQKPAFSDGHGASMSTLSEDARGALARKTFKKPPVRLGKKKRSSF